MVLRSLTQLLLALCLASIPETEGAVSPFTNCLDILKLPPEVAQANHPARIRGVVTSYVPSSQLCFVQDETAGIYVFPSPWPKDLAAGDVVEVEGVTGAGRFSPIVQWGRIKPAGEKGRVEPKRIAIEELNTGRYDCQYVELEGVVQSLTRGGDVVNIEVFTGGSSALVLLFDNNNSTTNWVDARVRLRGVAGTFYDDDRLMGFGLFVSDESQVEIIAPADNAFERPMRTTGKLAWFSPEGALDHRIRLRGVVALSWPGDSFFLHDGSGSIRVLAPDTKASPAAGDVVEVAGFVREATGPSPWIAKGIWKKNGSGKIGDAQIVSVEDLVQRAPNGAIIATEATVLGTRTNAGISVVLMEHGGQITRAYTGGPVDEKLRGARVKVTGLWATAPEVLNDRAGPGIWLAGTNQIAVLSIASLPLGLGPAGNVGTNAALAAGIGALVIGGFLAWRGYHARGLALAGNRASSERAEALQKEVGQLKEARERLGRDLHDHIIQSIYAVGLNLEDCRQVLGEPGKAEPRLRTALTDINGVIRELRNAILGLETNAIQPQEFRTALKSLGLTLGDDKANRIRLDIDQGAVDLLTTGQATELVHIAREAMSNSVRHGKAHTTTFSLHMQPESIRFVVDDDGRGFNVEGSEGKGYGLRNMAKRAEALGAKFTVQSQEGAGTRIVLDIPKQNQHFSMQ